MPIALTRFNFSSHEGWFDMRELGTAFDHREPCPIGMRSSAVASKDHQRGVVMRRRDGRGTVVRLRSSTAGPAEYAPLEQSAVFLSPMSALQQHITDLNQKSRRVRNVPTD
jgi:hypothetical protein